ncbi:MAG: YibE/F family protein [Clostridia bacterium]
MNKKILTGLIIFLILTQILGINISNADEQGQVTEETQENTTQTAEVKKQEIEENVKAKVIEAGKSYERDNGNGGKEYVQNVKVKILEGEEKDEKFDTTYVLTYDLDNKIVGYELKEGNTVYVGIQKENDEIKIIVQDVVRQNYLIGLVIFFFASIILVGRKKGIKAIIGLIITVLAVFIVLLAAIFKGYNAILVSIGTCFIIIVLTFTVIDGWNKKTISAALGTLGGVILAGIIAIITGYLAKLSGAGKEEAIMLSIASDTVFNFRDLLFAEIIVSALGACMDVGMSIASSLSELKIKNPSISGKELFKSGMNIGGDMIGTMTNTLILSFIGSSLILVLLYMSSQVTFTEVINIEAIATECVCALSGSIGIVYTVPITAAIFSFINRNKEIYKVKSENIIEGKRSLKL